MNVVNCSAIMIKMRYLIVLCLTCTQLFSQQGNYPANPDFGYYKELNDKEVRLAEYKDNDEALKLKLNQLNAINNSRNRYRVSPLRFDILSSRVANKMCREAAENGYLSHINLAGEKPYHRYALAGGYDHIAENASSQSTSGSYEKSSAAIAEMMKEGHESFMSERAPYDGHKKNVIKGSHNYVGLGYYITDHEFRYYEEYVDRYLEFENIPTVMKTGVQGSITIITKGKIYPYFLIVYRDEFPKPQTVSQLQRTGSYGDFSNEDYLDIPAWDLTRYKNGNRYTIPLKFTKEGLFYLQLYIDDNEYTGSTALDTKGKTVATGIVIKVEN
jgi:uncharacterized protein YkwD